MEAGADFSTPTICAIDTGDLKDVLRKGFEDFGALRTDVLFLGLLYPVVMLAAIRLAFGVGLLPLVFPMATGLALLGPLIATGVYELSRRREQNLPATWRQAFAVFRSPAIGSVLTLGFMLLAIFVLWMAAAQAIYESHYGDMEPPSFAWFVREVLTTPDGWSLIIVGHVVGFAFALVAFVVSAVSFPMIVDRHVRPLTAVLTSLRVFARNPMTMLVWAVIIAVAMMAATLPLFIGLIVVMPVLGHASWHLYRRTVRF